MKPLKQRSLEALLEHQHRLRCTFNHFFAAQEYQEVQEEPLVPRNDKTLLFTNATIVAVKDLIAENRIPEQGVYIDQACLRLHNLKSYESSGIEADPEYMSYFRMLGTLVHPSKYRQHADHLWRMLTRELGVAAENVRLLANSQDRSLIDTWTDQMPDLELIRDTKPEKYYRWIYGMDRISGCGATFAILQPDGRLEDFGNIIEIRRDGEPVAYEFGFGVETFLSRLHDLDGPFNASRISHCLPEHSSKLLIDLTAVATVMYANGVSAGEGGRHSAAKKVVKRISGLIAEGVMTQSAFTRAVQSFEKLEYGEQADASAALLADVERYCAASAKNEDLFVEYLRYQRRQLARNTGISESAVMDKILISAEKSYNLKRKHAESLIRKYFKDETP